MSINVRKEGVRAIITVDDKSLSRETASELKEKALEVIESGTTHLDLDLARSHYIDSSGIGKLLFINKKLQGLSGKLTISRVNPTLYEFLDSLAITKVIEVANP